MLSFLIPLLLSSQTCFAVPQMLREETPSSQNVLREQPMNTRLQSSLLEMSPDSIGVLFETTEQAYVQTWLPLGERVYNDNTAIPLEPVMAKITTMTTSRPQFATPEALALVECTIYPRVNETARPNRLLKAKHTSQVRSVSFRISDGYVQLAASGSRFWIGGAQVESIECK